MNWNALAVIITLVGATATTVGLYYNLKTEVKSNKTKLSTLEKQVTVAGQVIPQGAIAYFDLNSCPDGWQEFSHGRGRFLLASNPTTNGLSIRTIGEKAGTESHKLSLDEIAPHNHQYQDWYYHDSGRDPSFATGEGDDKGIRKQEQRTTVNEGGGKSHNNMPPYLVLLQCIKT